MVSKHKLNSHKFTILLEKYSFREKKQFTVDLIFKTSFFLFLTAGRYQIRVASLDSPDIHTPWQEIVVGKFLFILKAYFFMRTKIIIIYETFLCLLINNKEYLKCLKHDCSMRSKKKKKPTYAHLFPISNIILAPYQTFFLH